MSIETASCCRCGSRESLRECSQCRRPVCPSCRASPGSVEDYTCVRECTLSSFLGMAPREPAAPWPWWPGVLCAALLLSILAAVAIAALR